MTYTSATNLTPYAGLPGTEKSSRQKQERRRQPNLPPQPPSALVSGYVGRVSTFYSAKGNTYSETYEPVRKTDLGDVWRIESRFVSGRWQHLPFSLKGELVTAPSTGAAIVDEQTLPLMFDPTAERQFAQTLLEGRPKVEFVRLDDDITVYRSSKDQSVGIVREHVGRH